MKKRYLTLFLFLSLDFISSVVSLLGVYFFARINPFTSSNNIHIFSMICLPFIVILVNYILKIYNILWSYSHFMEIFRIIASAGISCAALAFAQRAIFNSNFKLFFFVIEFFFLASIIIMQRLIYRILKKKSHDAENQNIARSGFNHGVSGNIMVIGAGDAGELVIKEMQRKNEFNNAKVKCVIDDDSYKIGQYIAGVKIIGGREKIVLAAKEYDISVIIFAIPSASNAVRTEILKLCQQTSCKLKILPGVCCIYNPDDLTSSIRNVEIDDLLGRDPIDINNIDSLSYLKDEIVLVTGGGGTIGSELCRQIALQNPKKLIIFDIYENNAYEIQNELSHKFPSLNLVTLIGSVRDSKRLDSLFCEHRPTVVFHAAAHKHVPLMEDSPNEAIKNNVFGTYKTANCADKYGVKKFVLISSDKAVNPTNIMGATKRICEMIIQNCNKRSNTDFVAVRFGNVLGSNGSVIPLFKKQIEYGGPVTVTDPNIYRYFMSVSEAVSLVLQAGASAQGGEIFVLDMGEPVKILTLAENLIKLSGFVPYKDIDIEFIGLRPGEKLYEELLMMEEGLRSTANSLIYIGRPIDFDEEEFDRVIKQMYDSMYDESSDIREFVKKLVPTYKPQNISE